jgi:hypothetical protein
MLEERKKIYISWKRYLFNGMLFPCCILRSFHTGFKIENSIYNHKSFSLQKKKSFLTVFPLLYVLFIYFLFDFAWLLNLRLVWGWSHFNEYPAVTQRNLETYPNFVKKLIKEKKYVFLKN